ncbi:aconitate hydratase [Nitrosovibrio sp. Nv17]|uniref:aconitate hydratase n=1 Tax=Nitrosovibrio sp. Nv17 TaxID=1855339 RepID=UPI0009091DF3|nr:aconitate hydratase [Nitrosovibrio sp. Nv17]SFW30813.1 aconitase [Nitrosovibrio sp. Nv17]
MTHDPFNVRKALSPAAGRTAQFYSLPALEAAGLGRISRLPVSLRIVLESVLRNCDGRKITEAHVRQLAGWQPHAARTHEIPFVVSRIVLQDFTGVPLLVDLAAMRSVAHRMGRNPKLIEPLVPVDLVVDHSVQVDHYGDARSLERNMEIEFRRNHERYQFIKWGMQAFDTFRVVPPGIGIVHQVNLEYLARGIHLKDGVAYPDTLVGTDSHTTMINGIGVVGWGVGGIEAEAGMLGQPVYFLTPDVVGVHLTGRLRSGVTATDLVLAVTEMLRKASVVGKFVEFFGEGAASLRVPDRATIANMAPEYGATMGFFPVDDATLAYFRETGRSEEEIALLESYFKAQGLYGIPVEGDIDYTRVLGLDLDTVVPSVAGPRRPQDRIEIGDVKSRFLELFTAPVAEGGYGRDAADLGLRHAVRRCADSPPEEGYTGVDAEAGAAVKPGSARNVAEMVTNRPLMEADATPACVPDGAIDLGHGDILIAAITSCTNTSNPSVLIAAGLLARKAVERGLAVKRHIKTSLAPGSRVVTEYLAATGLLPYLERLGFSLAGYGCTTCIGNSGPLAEPIEEAVVTRNLVCAAVLSGNRNFEARIHPNIRANFLASPPLVVAYAIAGTMRIDLTTEPLGLDPQGAPVRLRDIWPAEDEIHELMGFAANAETFRRLYGDPTRNHALWNDISSVSGQVYDWPASTYIAEPPFFQGFSMSPERPDGIRGARVLGIFGDSVTTDHISPAGAIKDTSPAGAYLLANGVPKSDFNSYGARRGNHDVMMRGTFANVRIKNLMVPGSEGGVTLHQPDGRRMSIYDAAMAYVAAGVPTVVFGGEEYGAGSSRDWAAKGTRLLGVRAVIARSFERIHRSNLVGMGVLPLQFEEGTGAQSLGLMGDEQIDLLGLDEIRPQQSVTLVIRGKDGSRREARLLSRIDTPIEVDYYLHGGILPYVLRELMTA